MTAHRTSRRDFLKTAVAGASAAVLPLPAIAQGRGRTRRRRGRRIWRRDVRPLHPAHRPPHRRDPGRGEPDIHRLSVQQSRHRRPARPQGAGVRLRQARRRSGHRPDFARHRNRRPGPQRDARERRQPSLRPPGAVARNRYPLGRPARLHRSRRRTHAACVEGRRADAAAAPPARSDGGRRHGGDLGARQSVPLPARTRTSARA